MGTCAAAAMRAMPSFHSRTGLRVPEGVTPITNLDLSRNCWITSATNPLARDRSTGIPPSERMMLPSGYQKTVCLTRNDAFMPVAQIKAVARKKSILELCGTSATMALPRLGNSPSIFQPNDRNTSRPIKRGAKV